MIPAPGYLVAVPITAVVAMVVYYCTVHVFFQSGFRRLPRPLSEPMWHSAGDPRRGESSDAWINTSYGSHYLNNGKYLANPLEPAQFLFVCLFVCSFVLFLTAVDYTFKYRLFWTAITNTLSSATTIRSSNDLSISHFSRSCSVCVVLRCTKERQKGWGGGGGGCSIMTTNSSAVTTTSITSTVTTTIFDLHHQTEDGIDVPATKKAWCL